MKTLYYFRHSTKDGVNNTIGPKGLKLAKDVGEWLMLWDSTIVIHKAFHGLLVRTAQTALAFFCGFLDTPEVMPVVTEIGDDALFAEMVKPSQFRTLASAIGDFRALIQCHDSENIKALGALSMVGVVKMFDEIGYGETGVAFGHSPMIELALMSTLNTIDLPEEYLTFGDMEGVELHLDEHGTVTVIRKISMPAA